MEEPTTPNTDDTNETGTTHNTEPSGVEDNTEPSGVANNNPETGARFETPPPPPPTAAPAPAASGHAPSHRRLFRTNGPISGVSGGLGDYFGVDPTLVRVGMVLGTLLAGPVIPIAYVAAWVIVPEDNPAEVAPIMSPQPPPPSYAPAPAEVG